jgi:hypothetical protein
LRSIFTHQFQNCFSEQTPGEGWESDQDDTRGIHAPGEYEPAKVLVFRQEYPVLGQRKVHYVSVHGTVLKFVHCEHIMAVCPKSSDRGEIAALICEETHCQDLWRTERHDGFVRDGIGRVSQCGPNVACN